MILVLCILKICLVSSRMTSSDCRWLSFRGLLRLALNSICSAMASSPSSWCSKCVLSSLDSKYDLTHNLPSCRIHFSGLFFVPSLPILFNDTPIFSLVLSEEYEQSY